MLEDFNMKEERRLCHILAALATSMVFTSPFWVTLGWHHTSSTDSICCFCYMGAPQKAIHWLEFIPSMKLQSSYTAQTASPDPKSTKWRVANWWNVNFGPFTRGERWQHCEEAACTLMRKIKESRCSTVSYGCSSGAGLTRPWHQYSGEGALMWFTR